MGAVQWIGWIGAGYDDHVALAVKLRLGDRNPGGSTPADDRNDALNVWTGNSEARVSEFAAQLEIPPHATFCGTPWVDLKVPMNMCLNEEI